MKKHTKVLMDHLGYKTGEFIPCEVCSGSANQVHHIDPRGMGGSKLKDYPDNLLFLCYGCHRACESGAISREFQKNIVKARK
jgi:hypothetical protein